MEIQGCFDENLGAFPKTQGLYQDKTLHFENKELLWTLDVFKDFYVPCVRNWDSKCSMSVITEHVKQLFTTKIRSFSYFRKCYLCIIPRQKKIVVDL